VTRIAVSGHRGLSTQVDALVDNAIRAELSRYDSAALVGISCLADGADQIFASAILDRGAALEVIVPADEYRSGLPADARQAYDRLLRRATTVKRLDHRQSTSTAHMEASVHMLQGADILFAVWDGKPARAFGGTADVVAYARSIGLPAIVIWPEGVTRD
jgi:hypothetical protein